MKFEVLGKNGFNPTNAIKAYAQKRFEKVVSFFGPEVVDEIRVVCKVYKDHHKVEVNVFSGKTIVRAEVSDEDMYAAIDKANDKLVSQIRKHKDKLKKTILKKKELNKRIVKSLMLNN